MFGFFSKKKPAKAKPKPVVNLEAATKAAQKRAKEKLQKDHVKARSEPTLQTRIAGFKMIAKALRRKAELDGSPLGMQAADRFEKAGVAALNAGSSPEDAVKIARAAAAVTTELAQPNTQHRGIMVTTTGRIVSTDDYLAKAGKTNVSAAGWVVPLKNRLVAGNFERQV